MTGFEAYLLYIVVHKMHFGSKFDITSDFIPRNKLIHSWNERVHRDGKLFYKVEEVLQTRKRMTLAMCYYHLESPEFYIIRMIEDNFELFHQREAERNNLVDSFKYDMLRVITDCSKMKFKDIIFSSGCPKIFKLDLSPFTLVILDKLFNFNDKIDLGGVNGLEKKKTERYKNSLYKFKRIVYKELDGIDWKQEFNMIVKGN